jgi:hypothetical protein
MKTRLFIACTTLSFALAACGGAVASGGASPTATAQSTASSAASPTTTASTNAKVSANDATQAELQAAVTAVGVPNPSNWVREVVEYRPYPTNDPTFAKLRGELAKYNPAAGIVDKIISALSLP